MALTGFAVNGICAADSDAAIQSLAMAFPQIVTSGFSYFSSASFVAPNTFSLVLKQQPLPSGSVVTASFDILLNPCDPVVSTTSYFDGMQMGWGVVSAMAVAAAIILLKNSFFR